MADNEAFTPVQVGVRQDENREENVEREEVNEPAPAPRRKGPRVVEKLRLHHAYGGNYTDFENEDDLLDFIKEASTVKVKRNPDGSKENVYSPNAHLVHGAAHPDYPNLRVEKVSEVQFPDDDEDDE